jgi:hypothetical protein
MCLFWCPRAHKVVAGGSFYSLPLALVDGHLLTAAVHTKFGAPSVPSSAGGIDIVDDTPAGRQASGSVSSTVLVPLIASYESDFEHQGQRVSLNFFVWRQCRTQCVHRPSSVFIGVMCRLRLHGVVALAVAE